MEKASVARVVAETELIILREATSKNSATEAELEKVSAELNVLKEAEAKLALSKLALFKAKVSCFKNPY